MSNRQHLHHLTVLIRPEMTLRVLLGEAEGGGGAVGLGLIRVEEEVEDANANAVGVDAGITTGHPPGVGSLGPR